MCMCVLAAYAMLEGMRGWFGGQVGIDWRGGKVIPHVSVVIPMSGNSSQQVVGVISNPVDRNGFSPSNRVRVITKSEYSCIGYSEREKSLGPWRTAGSLRPCIFAVPLDAVDEDYTCRH